MTSISADAHPGGPVEPHNFDVTVTGAPVQPTNAYASNFTAGTDSFTVTGAGGVIENDTDTTPDSLRLTGPTNHTGEAVAARLVSGLTIGAAYRLQAMVTRDFGQVRIGARTADASAILARTAYLAPPLGVRTALRVYFTATATAEAITFGVRHTPANPDAWAEYRLDTITVQPSGTWLGTHLFRTDANGVGRAGADAPDAGHQPRRVDGRPRLRGRDGR